MPLHRSLRAASFDCLVGWLAFAALQACSSGHPQKSADAGGADAAVSDGGSKKTDAGPDAGRRKDAGSDAGRRGDAGTDAAPRSDAGHSDAGHNDAGSGDAGGSDAGHDAGGSTPVNQAPHAGDDSLGVDEGGTATSLTGSATSLLANDSDPEGGQLTVTVTPVTAPSHGSLTLHTNGTFSYTHDGSETTSDSFSYEVCDDGSPVQCANASVSITVTPVNDPPSAGADHYSTVGNTLLSVGSSGAVLANDSDPEGNSFTIGAYDVTSAHGGSVTLNTSNGTFTYLPPAGFVGTDSFTYTITDTGSPPASGIGTAEITVAGMVWYVDNSGANGSGRSTQPFNDLASAQSASAATDVIFVHTGTGPYDGGIVLKNGQQLLGQGVGLSVLPNAMIAAGTAPALARSNGDAITLASDNLVAGLQISSANGNAITGSGISGATVIANVSIAAPGGTAVRIINGGTVSLSNAGAISGASGLVLQGLSGVTVPDSGISINASAGPALDISNGGTLTLTFDALSSTNSPSAGLRLASVSGSVLVKGSTQIDASTSEGIRADAVSATVKFGNVTISNRKFTGIFVDHADGPSFGFGTLLIPNPNAVTQDALHIQNSSAAFAVSTVIIDAAATAVTLLNDTGSFALSTSGSTAGQGGTITRSTGDAIVLDHATKVAFDGLLVDITGGNGITGTRVNGFLLRHSRVQNAGNAAAEGAIVLRDAMADVLLQSSVLTGMADMGLDFESTTAEAVLTLDGVEISHNDANTYCGGLACGGAGAHVKSAGKLELDVVNGSLFNRIDGNGVELATTGPNANMIVNIQDSSFTDSPNGNSAVQARAEAGLLDFVVGANTMSDWDGDVISATIIGNGANVTGIIIENAIVANNHNGAAGIHVIATASAPSDTYQAAVIAVDTNNVSQSSGAGIWMESRDAAGSGARLDATVTNNTTSSTGSDAYRVSSSTGTLLCAHVEANTANTPVGGAYNLAQNDASTLQLEGTAADASTEIQATNVGTPVSATGTIAIVASGTCKVPPGF